MLSSTMNGRNIYERFEIVENKYGKANVRMLHLRREGLVHTIREFEVDTSLTLDDTKDYTKVDQCRIINDTLNCRSKVYSPIIPKRATTRTSWPQTVRKIQSTFWPSAME